MDNRHAISIMQRDWERAIIFFKSSFYINVFWKWGGGSENCTHPLKRLKYSIGKERATHKLFCSVLSGQAKKGCVSLSYTPQPPSPDLWTDHLNPGKDKACYPSKTLLFYSLRGPVLIYPICQKKELYAILFNKLYPEYDSRSLTVHSRGNQDIIFK